MTGCGERERAAKAAHINISPQVEIMIPGACWPSHKSWAHLRDRCADNSGAASRPRLSLSRIHDLGVSRDQWLLMLKERWCSKRRVCNNRVVWQELNRIYETWEEAWKKASSLFTNWRRNVWYYGRESAYFLGIIRSNFYLQIYL